MIKLITPPGMLLTVALLAIYSAYAFLIGSIEESWILLGAGAMAIVAAYGTAMLKPWSRYMVYALAAGFLAKLGLSVYSASVAGFFDHQFASPGEAARSLLPSAMMATLSCVCCYLVFRNFNRSTNIGVRPLEPSALEE